MYKKIEKQILEFAKVTGLTERREIVHGTLYVKLHEEKECDHFHKVIRTFYKDQINKEGGVNMYAVGDEFAFDFVPEDREQSWKFINDEEYSGKEGMMPDDIDKGIWSDFAEEGLMEDLPDDVDTLLELENEMKRGK